MNFKSFCIVFLFIILFFIFSLSIFVASLSNYGTISTFVLNNNISSININNSLFLWPTPGYTTITSPFGPRRSPTTGYSSFHYGIDIGAPIGSNIISICSGQVIYTGFKNANGFTVTIKNNNFEINYSHVSPNFIVYVGQYINKGETIAKVGPKNVYNVPNNPYKDSNGNPTNRINNRPTFTFKYKN